MKNRNQTTFSQRGLSPRAIEFLIRGLLLIVTLLVCFGVAELLLRGLGPLFPRVKFLATADVAAAPRQYQSLEDVLGDFRLLSPHQNMYNYYSNALGFTDREFARQKESNTTRLMGLGDSFLYGYVPYSENVLTLTGELLRQNCRGLKIETMNFGVPGTGTREYRLLHKFAAARYNPDIVIVHFYMGNDGPSIRPSPSIWRRLSASSYTWTFVKNAWMVMRSVERSNLPAQASALSPDGRRPVGGTRVNEQLDITDEQLPPLFTEEAFNNHVLRWEFGALYRGKTEQLGAEAWKATIKELDALREEVTSTSGRPPLLILYPSQLQVYPERFESAKRTFVQRGAFADPSEFDPTFPNRLLLTYCTEAGLSCLDVTPALIEAARHNAAPLYRTLDTHWNIRGNRIVAAVEADFLKREICDRVAP